ncbi:hypothetical protein ACQ7C6_12315 [Lactiplantibacillus plantarum]|nr:MULTISPECIES: hypothetical protein [Lactiplantibacillus]MDO7794972.1 hypothetical protein [Lactiplantibacillus plantarum]GIP78854.1 hypothetical protein ITOLOC_28490 [Lactiplantibacillus plantarum]
MTKTLKQLVHVLWAIEKDLHAIASNTEVSKKFVAEDSDHKKISQ